jgi:predicted nucleic acid-binding protein
LKAVVLDCSAAVPWFFPEKEGTCALGLLADLTAGHVVCLAPYLLHYEFASVAWKKVRRGNCDIDTARVQVSQFMRLPVRYVQHQALVDGALQLAYRHAISVYDASYLWLAVSGTASLATADAKLREAAGSCGVALVDMQVPPGTAAT